MNSSVSRPLHNWFLSDSDTKGSGYCNFTGVTCSEDKYVTALNLNGTGLVGSFPSSLTKFEHLRRLLLWKNNLFGEIPSSIATLKYLRHLELGNNKLDGSIPSALGSLSMLLRLKLEGNTLKGTIPSQICNMSRLVTLDISKNANIQGTLPSCLGNLLDLKILRVQDVSLTGSVPLQLCDGRSLDGIGPNLFGCDGVACRAGSFEVSFGRQTDGQTCQFCPVASNVIGSTSCRFVETRETFAPSQSPSSNIPSEVATEAPSFSPSEINVFQPSIFLISNQPSMTPTAFKTDQPSKFPSNFPAVFTGQPSNQAVATKDPLIGDSQSPSWAPSSPGNSSELVVNEPPTKAEPIKSQGGRRSSIILISLELAAFCVLVALFVSCKTRGSRSLREIDVINPLDGVHIQTAGAVSAEGGFRILPNARTLNGQPDEEGIGGVDGELSVVDIELQSFTSSLTSIDAALPSASVSAALPKNSLFSLLRGPSSIPPTIVSTSTTPPIDNGAVKKIHMLRAAIRQNRSFLRPPTIPYQLTQSENSVSSTSDKPSLHEAQHPRDSNTPLASYDSLTIRSCSVDAPLSHGELSSLLDPMLDSAQLLGSDRFCSYDLTFFDGASCSEDSPPCGPTT